MGYVHSLFKILKLKFVKLFWFEIVFNPVIIILLYTIFTHRCKIVYCSQSWFSLQYQGYKCEKYVLTTVDK